MAQARQLVFNVCVLFCFLLGLCSLTGIFVALSPEIHKPHVYFPFQLPTFTARRSPASRKKKKKKLFTQ